MTDDDDRDWLDALAGRPTRASATRREANALREALRASEATRASANTPDLAREAALISRAVDEGLIAPAATRPRPRWHLALAASVLLMLSAGIIIQLYPGSSPQVERGEDAIVRITADDPAALKQRILDELRATGAEATGYEALGAHGIDAELPQPLTAALERVLEKHGIPEPADGVLRIEIRSRQ